MDVQSLLRIKDVEFQCQPDKDGKGLVTLPTSLHNQFRSQLMWAARKHIQDEP